MNFRSPKLYMSTEVEDLELLDNEETIEDRIALIEADIDDIMWECLNK